MNVLVFFEIGQQRSAQRTVALLAEKFIFDADLLVYSTIDLTLWSKTVRGKARELRATGSFKQAVAKACAAKHYDLVVAAPSDRRGLLRLMLGSGIGRMVGAAPATILVPQGETVRLQRIVVGVSGGPQSEQDARLASRLAIAYNARLELAYVVSQVPLLYTSFAEYHDALQSDTTIANMAPGIAELRRINGLLKDEGAQTQVVIRTGAVTDELVEVCRGGGKDAPADLLVIGAHASSGTAPTSYLENLTEDIAESVPCPTLVVHANSEWTEWEIKPRDLQ